QRLQASVLAALDAGIAPSADVLQSPVDSSATVGKLVTKLLGSLGIVAAVTLGVMQLRSPSQPAPLPEAGSTAVTSVAATLPTPEVAITPPASATEPVQVAALAAPVAKNAPESKVRTTATKPLPSEAALIEQARSALLGSPARALALTETHARLYPKGILTQEREVIAIEALARLGKARAAEQRGSNFRSQQPHSIHELRLRQVLGDAGVPK
ncbi:MAG TPA: hypothetical protein VKP30_15735, partial [Polyangiaceae bacterium]|nr:hypothetical protein [Polyangiaceae bacterium]